MLVVTRRSGRLSILLLAIAIVGGLSIVPRVLALPEVYTLGAYPLRSQEGTTITLLLHVQSAAPLTTYTFVFNVTDPASTTFISSPKQYTTLSGQTEFYTVIYYPSSDFNGGGGVNSLVGLYTVRVSQTQPVPRNNVASTFFLIGLTDKSAYQRTETVSIQATAYQPGEPVTVMIRTSPSSVTMYNHPTFADLSGMVLDRWYIPANADTAQTYVVTITGSATNKTPADVDTFTVNPAIMAIGAISTNRSIYSRTETVRVSFEPIYPSLQNATTGSANVTLIRPSSTTFNIRATYDPASLEFVANYKTTISDLTGTWTARLAVSSFDDGNGNKGPSSPVTTSFTLGAAVLSVSTTLSKASYAINEQIPFNATISYPDGSALGSAGQATARLVSNGGSYAFTWSLVYDTASSQWKGLYVPNGNEPSGLWSLTVNGTDASSPINTGASSSVIALNKRATSLSVTCTPSQITVGQQVTCTATVSDADVGTAVTPTGSVTISPAFANPQTCTLPSGAGSTASCSVIFVTGPNSQGPNSITVSYSGDNREALSSTSSSLTIQPPSSGSGSSQSPFTLPLFYFAIIAAIIAGIVAVFLAFRHKTTHTQLKIDLEAVKSEAGKIENQEFFQSVKDQLTKDKDELNSKKGEST